MISVALYLRVDPGDLGNTKRNTTLINTIEKTFNVSFGSSFISQDFQYSISDVFFPVASSPAQPKSPFLAAILQCSLRRDMLSQDMLLYHL